MNYVGTIIEESLENRDILKEIRIVSTEVEDVTEEHHTPWIKQWTIDRVEIAEDQADRVAEALSIGLDKEHVWYADFKNEMTHFIIFPNKIFKVNRKNPSEYKEVTTYGIFIGIPDYQLDFSPAIEEWQRNAKI